MTEISTAEWDAALREAFRDLATDGEGMSSQEIADAMGIQLWAAQRRIRRLVRSGLWQYAGKALRRRIDDAEFPVPVYCPRVEEE